MKEILLAIIILILFLMIKKPHNFWSKQPVMRNYDNKNLEIIGFIPDFKLNFNKSNISYRFSNNIEDSYKFVNKNFNLNYNIDYNYFKYCFTKNKSKNIDFILNNKIIGFIHCEYINIVYYNKTIGINFVDFLCVEDKYRNKNLASLIIATLLNSFKNKNSYFLFKIEGYSLPFKSVIKTYYYYNKLQFSNIATNIINVKDLSNQDILKIYKIYTNLINKYVIHIHYNYDSFYKVFVKCNINSLLIINHNLNNSIFIIGKKSEYKVDKKAFNCFDIEYILGNTKDAIDINNKLSNYLISNNFKYYSIAEIGDNYNFISKNNLQKTQKLYYYTYNLNLPLTKKELFILNKN